MKKLLILAFGAIYSLQAELSPEALTFQKTGKVELTTGDKVKAALMGPVPCAVAGVAISVPMMYLATRPARGSVLLAYSASTAFASLTLMFPIVWYDHNIDKKEIRKKNRLKHEINTHNFKQECNKVDLTLLAKRKQELDHAINTQSKFAQLSGYLRNCDYPQLTVKEKASYTQQAFDTRAIEKILGNK
jgi:hypothetical protein